MTAPVYRGGSVERVESFLGHRAPIVDEPIASPPFSLEQAVREAQRHGFILPREMLLARCTYLAARETIADARERGTFESLHAPYLRAEQRALDLQAELAKSWAPTFDPGAKDREQQRQHAERVEEARQQWVLARAAELAREETIAANTRRLAAAEAEWQALQNTRNGTAATTPNATATAKTKQRTSVGAPK